ncbi:MAG TPA: dienelactone hydrolase family protein [Thermodesulfobacteriota bacterium]|nr:dienelactone hydrolase family protein [Thermodesulfobacteriota bacterium]
MPGPAGASVALGPDRPAFLATPASPGPYATVVLLHERYGLVQHTLDLARRFAADGFACLAPDLFAPLTAEEREALARGELRRTLSDPEAAARLGEALDWLRAQGVAAGTAVMGVCQTARYALVAAAERPEVRASLIAYGAAQPREWEVNGAKPQPLEAIIAAGRAPVLGLFGELDHIISVDDVRRLRDALERHRRSYRLELFADAPHGWLNDTMPGRYRPAQAEAAWRLTVAFLREAFGGGYPPGRVRASFASDVSAAYDFSRNRRLE